PSRCTILFPYTTLFRSTLESKIMPWMQKYVNVTDQQYEAIVEQGYGFRLQPVTDIHLHSHLRWELGANGHIEYIYILSAAALLTDRKSTRLNSSHVKIS